MIKGYVEVNDKVEMQTMKYLGEEELMERQNNERNRVIVIFFA